MTSTHLRQEILYKEAGVMLRYVCDWRHRIMSRYFIMLSAFSVVAGWLWREPSKELHWLIWMPFSVAALASLLLFFMDLRNTQIYEMYRCTASKLEENCESMSGPYSEYGSTGARVIRVAHISSAIYLIGCVLCIAASVLCFMYLK